ncbi:peptide chain release factor N(5)-glutamine methyltransferase [Tranquillimonas rosea]|uniref:peptide chain release factor N(5)-glutamine methyltransferase n=1 Tax=Tranquillimonas rosea TaxID=641238 RepID=UPI003BAA7862
MTGDEALRAAIPRLRDAGIEGAPRDARWLLAHALGIEPGRVPLVSGDTLPEAAAQAFEAAVARRVARVPVSQITGRRAFYGRDFAVTSDTLDPRPETEQIVALALEAPFARVLDLGTGTGCLLLTLLAECPGATGLGTDLSGAACAVARRNAAALEVADRAGIVAGDWFAPVTGTFDLIVSNPPYIAAAEMPDLAPEVRDHDPRAALTDEADGLSAFRVIAAGAGAHLSPGGRLLVEIGAGQGAAVAALFRQAGLDAVAVHRDIDSRDRVVTARKKDV